MTDRSSVRRALLILLLIAIALCVLLYLPFRHEKNPGETPGRQPSEPPPAADTAVHGPVTRPPLIADTLPVRTSRGRKAVTAPAPVLYRPATLDAEIEVLEFIRDFYGDVNERSVALLLRGSRLDSAAPSYRVLRGGFAGDGGWPVKHFVLSVDSVRPLRMYIFPGWSYGSDWAPLPDGSLELEGKIAPRSGTSLLATAGGKVPLPGEVERRNDRLSIRLKALPGYSYFVRFGLECQAPGEKDSSVILYAKELAVEFPAVLRCGSLSKEAGDTLYIAAHDPAAIHEVAVSFPGVPIVAVLLDADPDAEWTMKDLTTRSDVTVFLNTTSAPAESFLVLNDARAIVERRDPDPAFERILRSHLGSGLRAGVLIDDDPSRPVLRRTNLLKDPEAVRSLRSLFRLYVRESARQL